MTRQMKAVLGLGLGLSLALSRPGLAQEAKQAISEGKAEAAKGAAESAQGEAVESFDKRVQFDKDSAKGEVMCKQGKLKGDTVEYDKCSQDKLDKYEDIAVLKKIITKEKLSKLDAKKKRLAKKLAFYDSARKKLKEELSSMGEDKKAGIEYKKTKGALKKIDKEFDKSIAECEKEDATVFTCPNKD